MPGVVIGHNQNIAWGFTNLGADVTDLYLEKVTGDTYLYDGKQVPFTTREETIKVAGGADPDHHRAQHQQRADRSPTAATSWRTSAQNAPVGNAAPDRGERLRRRPASGPR